MAFSWKLKSNPPHDFFISLDIDSYFDKEHDPVEILEKGMVRPVPLKDRDVLVQIHFNGEVESPEFHIECEEPLDSEEVETANRALSRILGTSLDLRPLYDQAAGDSVLSPMFEEARGFKRMARASFYEDAVNRIIIAQIKHKPTAKKMVYGVREHYGTRLESRFGRVSAWPRPHQLMKADPVELKKHGLSLRKGEYIVGLAHLLVSGELSQDELEAMEPDTFYESVTEIRGIGPTTAQDLMLFRNRPDGSFPSHSNKGTEKGLRRWIIYSYGGDPDNTSEKEFKDMISRWKGYEAVALEHLYLRYVLAEKKKAYRKKQTSS